MRGYFTFLIVFAAFLLLISLAQFNTSAKTSNLGPAIWVERYYQVQMNAKEAVVEASREGVRDGLTSYTAKFIGCAAVECAAKCSACITVAGCALCGECIEDKIADLSKSVPCIQREINAKSIEKIRSLNNADFDSEIDVCIYFEDYEEKTCLNVCNPSSDDQDVDNAKLVVNPTINIGNLSFSTEFIDSIELDDLDASASNLVDGILDAVTPAFEIKGEKIKIKLSHSDWSEVEIEMPEIKEELS